MTVRMEKSWLQQFLSPDDDRLVSSFKNALNNKGILTTIRASRGQDICAACGLLSTKELVK